MINDKVKIVKADCVTKKPDICQCLEPEFRWFGPLIETVENEDEWVLVCRKCLRPKYKKDL